MTTFLPVLALGFFLGMRHATDPDHVIAVSTIVARHRSTRGAALIGAVWGFGHTLTIVLVGGAIILFRWVIPPRIGLSMELAVGVLLIVLGIVNVAAFFRAVPPAAPPSDPAGPTGGHAPAHVHSHAHSHGDYVHAHPHGHAPETHPHAPGATPLGWLDRRLGALRPYQLARPLVIGIVHGLAGSAAVALLVLTTIQGAGLSLLYLALFGLGTIAGMMLITMAIGVPFVLTGHRFGRLNHGLRLASGVVSLAFGLFLAYEIGIVNGLFSDQPQWTPH
ncbi:MAG: high-affinity nickel-transporter [Geminicoccaceae bacterium]|nr:high-affinity nickel-transporter [Geminicoccaceae bacterium]